MATKKTEAIEDVQTPEKEKMYTVTLERTRYETRPVYINVNGKTWLIPRGVPSPIPECAYLQLEHKAKMEAIAFEYSEGLKKDEF